VFTPNRDVMLLPEGSTALDFAYHVHTEVGHHAAGAKVNGRLVPLRTVMKTGDTVEIVTKPDAHPSRDWLQWATNHRAIQKIRRKLKDQLVDQGTTLGREILDGALRKLGSTLRRVLDAPEHKEQMEEAGFKDLDALAMELVGGRITPNVAARIFVQPAAPPAKEPGALASFLLRVRRSSESAIVVSGESDILVDYARCCRPMKGEPITGYITRGRGLSIHKSECAMMRGLDVERVVEVSWDDTVKTVHQGLLRLLCADRPGLLADITGACASQKINLWRAEMHTVDETQALCELGVNVHHVTELTALVTRLKRLRGVVTVDRAA
jgi:GTP pyrophosphokinase